MGLFSIIRRRVMRTRFAQNDEKARILKDIIVRLDSTRYLNTHREYRDTIAGKWKVEIDTWGEISAQFVPLSSGVSLPAGSIVKCLTNPDHDWGVARYVRSEPDHYVLSEIGNPKRTLRMYNERLQVLVGVPWHVTAEGWERRMYDWAIKAMSERWNKRADYFLRFRGAELKDGVLTIKVGRHVWVNFTRRETPEGIKCYNYRQRSFDIPVDQKTRLKDIVQALCDADFDAEWTDDELEFDEKMTRELRPKAVV
jgi:hypothetical protein